ncbi:cyclin-related protein [Prunus dulcis]|uniref:Cyclin-related protein n=1 Tax=Prunus dulcis TaxID=3755 RepID=A0A4Y1S0E1_PRUDU|nr:cyclin-related protein [Prunus dulcis]
MMRSRRDGKDEKERVTSKINSESAKQSDQDQKHQPRLQDTLPLESPLATDSRVENGASRKESDKKPSGHLEGTKLSSDPTDVPRSQSYFQTCLCMSYSSTMSVVMPGKLIESSRRGSAAERGSWRDSKDRHDDRTVSKATTNDSRPRNEKPKGDENRTWRHNGFFEMEANPPPERKRPAFREKKISLESENGDKTTAETAKSNHPDAEGSRKREERGNNPRHLDRSEKQFAGERLPYRETHSGVPFLREKGTLMVPAATIEEEIDSVGDKGFNLVVVVK